MKFISSTFGIYLLNIYFSFIYSQNVSSICGVPSIPCQSKISPKKTQYDEGDVVTYLCDNEYINLNQTRKCVKGKWNGTEPICGKSNYNSLNLQRINIFEVFFMNICKIMNYKFASKVLHCRTNRNFELSNLYNKCQELIAQIKLFIGYLL